MNGSKTGSMATARGRWERILAHLAEHPDRTVHEICVELGFMRESGRGCTGGVLYLLRGLERQALVASRTEFRARQGRQVRLWRTAPLGTAAPQKSASQAAMDCRRERAEASKRSAGSSGHRVSARPGARASLRWPKLPVAAPWTLPPGAACRGADTYLFFPEPGQSDAKAKAICAVCPVRAECLAAALGNGERYGVWGGVNLEILEHAVDGVS